MLSSVRAVHGFLLVLFLDFEDLKLVLSTRVFGKGSERAIRVLVPLGGLGLTPQIFKHSRVGREQCGAPGKRLTRVQFRDFEFEERLLGLAQVKASAGHGDRQMHTLIGIERLRVDFKASLDGLFRTSEAALTVDHEGNVAVESAEPAVGAQLAQGEGKVARAVRSDRERLAGNRDPACATACGYGVLVCKLGIVVDEEGDHRQVSRHALLDLGLQRLQLIARRGVQIPRINLVRDDRVVVLSTDGAQFVLQALRFREFTVASAAVAPPAAAGTATAVALATITVAALATVAASIAAVIATTRA